MKNRITVLMILIIQVQLLFSQSVSFSSFAYKEIYGADSINGVPLIDSLEFTFKIHYAKKVNMDEFNQIWIFFRSLNDTLKTNVQTYFPLRRDNAGDFFVSTSDDTVYFKHDILTICFCIKELKLYEITDTRFIAEYYEYMYPTIKYEVSNRYTKSEIEEIEDRIRKIEPWCNYNARKKDKEKAKLLFRSICITGLHECK